MAWVAYADDALRWHHARSGSEAQLEADLARVSRWRTDNQLDVEQVIRAKRESGW